MGLKQGAKTKTGTKAKKPGPKGKRTRGIGTSNGIGSGPSANLVRQFIGTPPPPNTPLPTLNHLPQDDPPIGSIIRERYGKPPLIASPADLLVIAEEYFHWCVRNPMWEDRLVTFQGFATHEPVPKMRLRSIGSLCFFLGINHTTWYSWRTSRPDLVPTMQHIEKRIEEENKAGASADLMNAGFVARVMGLADRQEVTGKDGGPIASQITDIDLSKLTDEELESYRAAAAAIERIRQGN